jgi:phage tail sheath protein FI
VYIEETSFRAKSIEGVSTSTAGFVGPARFGPISGHPELITSFADFTRIYGGLEDLTLGGTRTPNYLAHGVRAFFEEGGKRAFVMRVFGATGGAITLDANNVPAAHYARTARRTDQAADAATPPFRLVARFPGEAGNIRVTFTVVAGDNVLSRDPADPTRVRLTRVSDYDLVHVKSRPGAAQPYVGLRGGDGLRIVRRAADGSWQLLDPTAAAADQSVPVDNTNFPNDAADAAKHVIRPLLLRVEVARRPPGQLQFGPPQSLGDFGVHLRAANSLQGTFTRAPLTRFAGLTTPFAFAAINGAVDQQDATLNTVALGITRAMFGTLPGLLGAALPATPITATYELANGDDGAFPVTADYAGRATFTDFLNNPLDLPKNGLLAFEAVEDISIVAAPGHTAHTTANERFAIGAAVVSHCERMMYRVAVLDTPANQLPTEALAYRNQRSSTHAALYYPWIVVADPQAPGQRLSLPPSGFVAGIYARNDVENAVFKAPANEVVRLAVDFEVRLNKAQQELLNPNGVNCFRFFEGRGYLLWGARTVSDDPEWKYVNVRRYFAYLERSIDKGTQWAVFQNNDELLWGNIRRTIEDFLYNEWRMGGLLGDKPEQAYFVRCDRSTMTQNDLDNGRLICLIGVAPVRPAEFVIFRIGQWTASSPA